jgi:hypothetical protein
MEIKQDQLLGISPMPPHKYGLWLKLFTMFILLTAFSSLIFLPRYYKASKKLVAAKIAYENKQLQKAIDLYQEILKTVPSSKTARIGISEAMFSKKDCNEEAFLFLHGLDLDNKSFNRIKKVMPKEYEKLFYKVKK